MQPHISLFSAPDILCPTIFYFLSPSTNVCTANFPALTVFSFLYAVPDLNITPDEDPGDSHGDTIVVVED